MHPELERARAFEEALRERCAERIVPFRFGRAVFNDSFPRVWDLNAVHVRDPDGATAAELAAEAERLHAEAGHGHRRVAVAGEAAGEALAPGFEAAGWQVQRFLYMAYRGEPEREVDASAVEEVSAVDVRPLREAVARGEPWATDDEVVRMVGDANELVAREAGARLFAVRDGGEAVAAASLFSDGRVAQVEDVATAPAHRGRGHASAVVRRAVEEALAAGHDLVFLVADEDDWPKDLYARLGFAPVGRAWDFLRTSA